MENISLDDFLSDGMIQEKDFRDKVKNIDWTKFSNKKVMIKGCAQVTIPTWAYLIIVSNLSFVSAHLYSLECIS